MDRRDRDGSTIELIGGLIGDARDLAVAHLDSLRLELSRELEELKTATRYAAAAAAVFAVAGLLAAFSLVQALWLHTSLPSWLAYLIIAAVFVAAGVGLLAMRARASRPGHPPRAAVHPLERDARWFARRTHDVVR